MAIFKVSGSLSQEEIKGGVASTPAAISGSPQLGCKTDAPVHSVNGKTGAVVLNADDIEPTVSRGWFTSLLANTLSAVAQWVSEVGSPHVANKSNPHETSFSNVNGYPTTPEGKVLTDRGTFDFVSAGGATNLPLYASNTDSLASGYKVLNGSPDATEVVKTIIASAATGIVAGEAHLSATPIGVSIIPAGTFEFGYFRSVNSAQGDSFKQVEIFTRSAAGVETSLFTLESSSIDDTELTERVISRTISQSYAVNPAHFLGVRFKFRTTRATATTLSYIVGGARGWWMRTTLPLKHDDLSDKNGNPDFQHITAAEKAKLGKLLVDFTVPTDTPSLEFLYTDGGVLLSSLGLKRVILSGKFITDIAAAAGSERLSINGDNTNTYASAVSSAVIGGFRFPVYKLMGFDAVLSITNNSCVLSGSVHASQNTAIVNTNTLSNISLSGIKDGATTINSIKIERLNNVFVFKAGSTIKIYRND